MEICDRDSCTGCGACMSMCTQCAITMRPDASGHIYPHVDVDRCVSCGVCAAVCPVINAVPARQPLAAYAVHARDGAARAASSSGGAAVLLARAAVSAGSVVYACVQDNYRNIYHRRITTMEDVERIRGSKYMQSDLRATYAECCHDLRQGRRVLYIGTPCQIAGLRATLGNTASGLRCNDAGLDYIPARRGDTPGNGTDNQVWRGEVAGLCTVDIICHGVPSQLMFRDNLDMIRPKAPVTEACTGRFRRKDGGKVRFGMYIYDGDRQIYARDYPNDYFIAGFLKGLFFRPNCFDCRYATDSRVGDITIGDFWGLGKEGATAIDSSKGVSLVMANTDCGAAMLSEIADKAVIEQRPLTEAVSGNAQLRHSFVRPQDYDEFHRHYREHGYESACRRYLDAYIRRNRRVMFNEEHPWLSLPLRIIGKVLNR